MVAFYVTYFVILAGLIAFLFINKKKGFVNLDKTVKIFAIVFVGLAFINIFLPDLQSKRCLGERIEGILSGHPNESYSVYPNAEFAGIRDPWLAIISWLSINLAVITVPIAVFFKKPAFNRVLAFVVLPFSIIAAAYYFKFIANFADPAAPSVFGEGSRVVLQNVAFRSVYFGILMLLETVISAYVIINNVESLKVKDYKEALISVGIAAALIFSNIPIYLPQHILNTYSKCILTIAYPGHFIFMALVAIEGVALYFLFRNKSYEDKYILLLVMSISLLFQYNTFFRTDGVINASRWPIQLCNIAGAFLIVTLLTKSEKMFHFTLVVNALGAVIAIAMCDSTFNTGIFYEMNIHYMVEHANVLLVPILAGLLRVFKPLTKKDAKHVVIGFAIYFVFTLILGTILTSIYAKTGNDFFEGVNFLFMFDRAKTSNLVGFAGSLMDINFKVGYATFSLLQPIVLIVFEGLCVGVFFAFYALLKEKKHAN